MKLLLTIAMLALTAPAFAASSNDRFPMVMQGSWCQKDGEQGGPSGLGVGIYERRSSKRCNLLRIDAKGFWEPEEQGQSFCRISNTEFDGHEFRASSDCQMVYRDGKRGPFDTKLITKVYRLASDGTLRIYAEAPTEPVAKPTDCFGPVEREGDDE
jgi:hypothetical protein